MCKKTDSLGLVMETFVSTGVRAFSLDFYPLFVTIPNNNN